MKKKLILLSILVGVVQSSSIFAGAVTEAKKECLELLDQIGKMKPTPRNGGDVEKAKKDISNIRNYCELELANHKDVIESLNKLNEALKNAKNNSLRDRNIQSNLKKIAMRKHLFVEVYDQYSEPPSIPESPSVDKLTASSINEYEKKCNAIRDDYKKNVADENKQNVTDFEKNCKEVVQKMKDDLLHKSELEKREFYSEPPSIPESPSASKLTDKTIQDYERKCDALRDEYKNNSSPQDIVENIEKSCEEAVRKLRDDLAKYKELSILASMKNDGNSTCLSGKGTYSDPKIFSCNELSNSLIAGDSNNEGTFGVMSFISLATKGSSNQSDEKECNECFEGVYSRSNAGTDEALSYRDALALAMENIRTKKLKNYWERLQFARSYLYKLNETYQETDIYKKENRERSLLCNLPDLKISETSFAADDIFSDLEENDSFEDECEPKLAGLVTKILNKEEGKKIGTYSDVVAKFKNEEKILKEHATEFVAELNQNKEPDEKVDDAKFRSDFLNTLYVGLKNNFNNLKAICTTSYSNESEAIKLNRIYYELAKPGVAENSSSSSEQMGAINNAAFLNMQKSILYFAHLDVGQAGSLLTTDGFCDDFIKNEKIDQILKSDDSLDLYLIKNESKMSPSKVETLMKRITDQYCPKDIISEFRDISCGELKNVDPSLLAGEDNIIANALMCQEGFIVKENKVDLSREELAKKDIISKAKIQDVINSHISADEVKDKFIQESEKVKKYTVGKKGRQADPKKAAIVAAVAKNLDVGAVVGELSNLFEDDSDDVVRSKVPNKSGSFATRSGVKGNEVSDTGINSTMDEMQRDDAFVKNLNESLASIGPGVKNVKDFSKDFVNAPIKASDVKAVSTDPAVKGIFSDVKQALKDELSDELKKEMTEEELEEELAKELEKKLAGKKSKLDDKELSKEAKEKIAKLESEIKTKTEQERLRALADLDAKKEQARLKEENENLKKIIAAARVSTSSLKSGSQSGPSSEVNFSNITSSLPRSSVLGNTNLTPSNILNGDSNLGEKIIPQTVKQNLGGTIKSESASNQNAVNIALLSDGSLSLSLQSKGITRAPFEIERVIVDSTGVIQQVLVKGTQGAIDIKDLNESSQEAVKSYVLKMSSQKSEQNKKMMNFLKEIAKEQDRNRASYSELIQKIKT